MATTFERLGRSFPGRAIRVFWGAMEVSMRRSHGHPGRFAREFRKVAQIFLQYRFWPQDALRWGLLDKKGDLGDGIVSKQRLVKYQNYLNHSSFHGMVEDKALFYCYCRRLGLPVPELYGVFFQQASGWSALGQQGAITCKDEFLSCLDSCPARFVIKPAHGVYGQGIHFVDKTAPNYAPAELYDSLMSSRYGSYVIQEALVNHPDIQALNNKKGLQTLRLSTFIEKDLSVRVVQASFKFIVGDNLIDNHCGGHTGNLSSQIDLDTGVLATPVVMTSSGIEKVPQHPDTGKRLGGEPIPHWNKACELAKAAALEFMPMRTIGWDIAITDRGPVLVEGNARWDPPNFGQFGRQDPFFAEIPTP